ncbi:aminopeptidase PepB [Zobellella denitrificans]|nr:aminopeptidase PepB [Zobellella denitrificans]OXS14859.1 aminopeptidase PepB [Zobellella denitrificans]
MLKVSLSAAPAAEAWGEGALLSYGEQSATVHLGPLPLRRIQRAGRRLHAQGVRRAQLAGDWSSEQQWAFALGWMSSKDEGELHWAGEDGEQHRLLDARLRCARWVRAQTNATPEQLSPVALAVEAASFLTELAPSRISHRILKGEALREAGFVGIYEVGRGSDREPALLELDFNPTGDRKAPVAACLVGKGITFDSGGYSIKASEGMLHMKGDMGGAALVTGALGLAMLSGLDKRVKLFLCCAENLISGHAYKLGDILAYRNGVTVEIVNTDAEGRLVLADGLLAAGETGAPLIIDAATLTGAAVMAVGQEYNALFALDQGLAQRALDLAGQEQEPLWQLPLAPWHREQCPSAYADTANSRPVKGGGPGGASNAAGFLSRFVPNEGRGWLHFDLAAAYRNSADADWSAGGTALGLRTLARLLLEP